MNPQGQGTGCYPAEPPLKRKRGRPRKDESLAQGENAPAMPVVDNMKKNKQSACTTGAVSDEMAGQVVSGVIEGSFDAGYLLKVKIGDSDTHLRGVVFLPGRFSPITASNDVAPQAKMYRRTEMSIPVANPQTLVPGPVPSLEQSDKQPVELQNLAPTVQVQGLPSEPQSSVLIPQENQTASNVLPLTDNLPMSSLESSLGGRVAPQQIMESELGTRSNPVMSQMVHDKVAEQDEVLKEFEGSITKVPSINVEATVQSQSVLPPAPSVDSIPSSGTVNLELQIQHQALNDEFKPNQSIHGVKSPNIEHNQVPVVNESEIMSAEPIGLNIWIEKLASPNKAAVPELAMNVVSGNDASHLNGRPVNLAPNFSGADSQSAPLGGLPVMLFEREAIISAPKLTTEESAPQRMIETELCNPSGATSILKADSHSTPVTSLPVTLFEREAIPSEPKLAIDGPVLPRITEPLFCSSSGAANNVDCNLKDAIPPAES